MKSKWVRTLLDQKNPGGRKNQTQPAPSASSLLSTNSFHRDLTVHEVTQDVALEDRPWTYREEVGTSLTEEILDFNLRHEEGIHRCTQDLGEVLECFVCDVLIKRPILRASNASDVVAYFPASFVCQKKPVYTLGFGSFVFDPAAHTVAFTMYFASDDVHAYSAKDTHKHVEQIPEVRGRVVYCDTFLILKPTKTPGWIYGKERKRLSPGSL